MTSPAGSCPLRVHALATAMACLLLGLLFVCVFCWTGTGGVGLPLIGAVIAMMMVWTSGSRSCCHGH